MGGPLVTIPWRHFILMPFSHSPTGRFSFGGWPFLGHTILEFPSIGRSCHTTVSTFGWNRWEGTTWVPHSGSLLCTVPDTSLTFCIGAIHQITCTMELLCILFSLSTCCILQTPYPATFPHTMPNHCHRYNYLFLHSYERSGRDKYRCRNLHTTPRPVPARGGLTLRSLAMRSRAWLLVLTEPPRFRAATHTWEETYSAVPPHSTGGI